MGRRIEVVAELTDRLGCDQMAKEGGEDDEDHGVGDPGQELQQHVIPQLTVHPLIYCKRDRRGH